MKTLEEVPLQCHLSRLSSPQQPGGGGCCSLDHPNLYLLLMETAWVPGNRHTHWHLYKETARKACVWMPTATQSIWAGGSCCGVGMTAPFSQLPRSPCDGLGSRSSEHQGLAGALWMPTPHASVSLVRICSWTSCLGPSSFWDWINTEGNGDGV